VGSLIPAVEHALGDLETADSVANLMSIEGTVRQSYYGAWDVILSDPDFRFEHRSKRPPMNRINALISFLNSMLYTTVLSEVYKTHLDPRIGYLHESNYRRFSLNLDVAEVFRPIIVDRLIFSLIAKKVLKAGDFVEKQAGLYMKQDALRRVVKMYEERLRSLVTVRKLRRKVSYRRLIRLELYKVQKHIMGDTEYEPYISPW